MQIAATLVKGKARIKFDAPKVIKIPQWSKVVCCLRPQINLMTCLQDKKPI